jgi:hypothetical protein
VLRGLERRSAEMSTGREPRVASTGHHSRCGPRRCGSTTSASRGNRRWTPRCSNTSS